MKFSEKVSFVREKLNMSQEELARALNVSYVTINRWENGKVKPIKIAQAAFDAFCEGHGVHFDNLEENKMNV